MYLNLIPQGIESLQNKTIMEVGPGQDLGVLLILVGLGSGRGVAADRYFCNWDPDYHPAFYSSLRARAEARYPGLLFETLGDVLNAEGHVGSSMQVVRSGLADLSVIATGSIDICYSNAALEHLESPQEGLLELARVSRTGGLGFHQIDFRDHRDFTRPLEFLTMTEEDFQEKAKLGSYCFGNRLRPAEYMRLFSEAGFDTTFTSNLQADPGYVEEVLSRLQPRYRGFGRDELMHIGGRVFTTRR